MHFNTFNILEGMLSFSDKNTICFFFHFRGEIKIQSAGINKR